MTIERETGRFFLPGPTEIHPDVAAAMLRPMMSHRGSEFHAMFARLQTGARAYFATEHPVVIASSSSTALMDMSVRAAPPGRILALVNGGFSQRFAKVARACGRDVDQQDVPWGRDHDLREVERALACTRYAALTVVHSETSTGVLTDVRAVAGLAHAQGVVALVDAVTSAGGAPLETDAWGLDFVFAGSQKTLALPPGLALGAAHPALVASARSNAGRGFYLDLAEYADCAARNETPSTPSLALLNALDEQFARIAVEGLPARIARHASMAAATHRWIARAAADGLGVGILAPEGHRSPTVTVITLPDDVLGAGAVDAMKSRGYTIASGYGPLARNCVRVGHMGEHTVEGVERCLASLGDVLRALRQGALR